MRETLNTAGLIIALGAGIFFLLNITDNKELPLNKQQQVLVHKKGRVAEGMVLHTVRSQAKAWLVDNDGVVQHEWNIKKYVPTQSRYTLRKSPLQHIEPRSNGELLAVVKDSAVVRLDSESNLLSFTEGHFHHDLDVLDDGTIVTLERKAVKVSHHESQGVLLNDHIVLIKEDELL